MVWAAPTDQTDMAATARVVSMLQMDSSATPVTVSTATPVLSEVVTAWEATVPLVLLHLAVRYLWRREVPQAPLEEADRAQVALGDPLLRLQGPKLKEDSFNKKFKRALRAVC